MLASHEDLARKLEELEKRYDAQFKSVSDAIRQLMMPPEKPRWPIGVRVEEVRPAYRRAKAKFPGPHGRGPIEARFLTSDL
jgi:hypothetical protein